MKKNIFKAVVVMVMSFFGVTASLLEEFNAAQELLIPMVQQSKKKEIAALYKNLVHELYVKKKIRQDQHAELLRLKDAIFLYAAFLGHAKIVELLLKQGEFVDQRSYPGYTALHYAIRGCYPDVVKLLLEHGASTLIESKYGETPALLVRESTPEIFELMQLYSK